MPERAELLDGHDQAGRRADLGQLLDRDEHHQRARPGAAVLLLERQAEQVVLAEELDHVPGELGLLVDLGRARGDALAGERAHEVADLALLVGQRVVGHGEESICGQAAAARARARFSHLFRTLPRCLVVERLRELRGQRRASSRACGRSRRSRRTRCSSIVEHRLDVVAVGVEHECRVVALVVLPLAGRPVVAVPGGRARRGGTPRPRPGSARRTRCGRSRSAAGRPARSRGRPSRPRAAPRPTTAPRTRAARARSRRTPSTRGSPTPAA